MLLSRQWDTSIGAGTFYSSGMLESLLHQWRSWGFQQRPVIERPLGLGRTNSSYLMRVDGRELVLRLNNSASVELGIDRRREQQILLHVSAAGIAPDVCYNNPAEGILITEYIRGEHWRGGCSSGSGRRYRLLELMDRIHGIKPALPRFDYVQLAEAYWQVLAAREAVMDTNLSLERRRMLPLLQEFQDACQCQGLCHHDPVPANIIDADGRLYMIDWEYAGRGCSEIDYAALSAECQLNRQQRQSTGVQCDQRLAGEAYQYLCLLWQALRFSTD
jgi:thiamine kinase-like enzyme